MKKRKSQRNNNVLLVYVLLIAVIFMVAGYALFSQNITLTGTASADADFSIVWTAPSITDSHCSTTLAPALTMANTVLTMNPALEGPTCFVEVTTSVHNNGNIPAIITGLVPTDPVGTDMIVTYAPAFAEDQTIAAGATIPVVITVRYNDASENEDPISETFGVVVTYGQDL